MIRGEPLTAVIPARGGSKGIPGKNLYKIHGVSLVEWAIRLGKASERVDKVLVSTDHPEIYAVAQKLGCATPRRRPEHLSTDSARTVEVVMNLMDEAVLGSDGCVLLLQPSSPLRTTADIDELCAILEARWEEADAMVSVCEIDGPHPYKSQVIERGYLRALLGRDASVPRQSLPRTYIPNGAFYLVKATTLRNEGTFTTTRCLPFMMPSVVSINLDGPLDMVLLEGMIERGMVRSDARNVGLILSLDPRNRVSEGVSGQSGE